MEEMKEMKEYLSNLKDKVGGFMFLHKETLIKSYFGLGLLSLGVFCTQIYNIDKEMGESRVHIENEMGMGLIERVGILDIQPRDSNSKIHISANYKTYSYDVRNRHVRSVGENDGRGNTIFVSYKTSDKKPEMIANCNNVLGTCLVSDRDSDKSYVIDRENLERIVDLGF